MLKQRHVLLGVAGRGAAVEVDGPRIDSQLVLLATSLLKIRQPQLYSRSLKRESKVVPSEVQNMIPGLRIASKPGQITKGLFVG